MGHLQVLAVHPARRFNRKEVEDVRCPYPRASQGAGVDTITEARPHGF